MAAALPANPASINALVAKLSDPDPDYRYMSLEDLRQMFARQRMEQLHLDFNLAQRLVDAVLKTLDDQNGEVQNLAIKTVGPLMTKVPSAVWAPTIDRLTNYEMKNSPDSSLPYTALRNVVASLPRPVSGVTPDQQVKETYNIIHQCLIPRIVGVSSNIAGGNMKGILGGSGNGKNGSGKNVANVPTTEAVDVLIEVVHCYGPLLQELELERLQNVVMNLLEQPSTPSTVKRRAVVALAMLGPYLPDKVVSESVSKIATALSNPRLSRVMQKLYLNITASLTRSIPHKMAESMATLMPLVLTPLSQVELSAQLDAMDEGDQQASIEFNDVRETAFVALEAFLAACGSQMRPYTESLISSCLRYLKYDPNYAVDADDDDDDEEMEDGEDGGGGSDEDEDDDDDDYDDLFDDDIAYDDDDDGSWKVRRCAVKTLYTLISTRSSDLLEKGTLYGEVAVPLVKRFDEREESVRLEIISTVALLVRKTGEGVNHDGVLSVDEEDDMAGLLSSGNRKRRRQSSSTAPVLSSKAPYLGPLASPGREEVPASGPRADLARLTPQMVKTCTKLLKAKQMSTKQAVMGLLADMIHSQHGGLADYLQQVMLPIVDVVKSSSLSSVSSSSSGAGMLRGGSAAVTPTSLRITALGLISDIVKTHSSQLIQPFLSGLIDGVVLAVQDQFYKVSAEAIRTAEELVKAITPPRARLTSDRYKPELQRLYSLIYGRATANDADTEVRQRAIQALGTLLSRTAVADDNLLSSSTREEALDVLQDRLRYETTRLHAVRAIDRIALHAAVPGMLTRDWLRGVTVELCDQLRKANRALRGASVQALEHLFLSPANRAALEDADMIRAVLQPLVPIIRQNDNHILAPVLHILAQMQRADPSVIQQVTDLAPSLCALLQKPAMTSSVLDALVDLAAATGETGQGKALMTGILKVGVAGDPAAVGKMTGALFVASSSSAKGNDTGVTIDSFLNELRVASRPDARDPPRQSLALAILGDISRGLGAQSPLEPQLFLDQLAGQAEVADAVAMSAAVAMGRAGSTNVSVFFPVILEEIKQKVDLQHHQKQYLLLHAVREILQLADLQDLAPFAAALWHVLFAASANADDNRIICAECIGRLALLDPKTYLPKLQALFHQDEANAEQSPGLRAVAIQAIRYTLPDRHHHHHQGQGQTQVQDEETFEAVLKTCLVDMLVAALQDEDREIRRLAMTTLNAAAHNKLGLVLPHLGQLMPFVMAESVIKPELIREVQMGPFKHTVDDGLEVRKSAYDTLYAIMATALSRLNTHEFYDRLLAGLRDEHDIRALCNLMLTKLIYRDPDEVRRRLDSIADCYRRILNTKLKEGAVKQEVEKQEEANRSVLRVTLLLGDEVGRGVGRGAAVGVGGSAGWVGYWEWVGREFKDQVKVLREREREGA